MSESATLTVTLTPQMVDRLAEIAAREHSTLDAVAAGAVADLLAREVETMAAISRGRADAAAGRIISQAEVVRDIRAIVDAARAAG